MLSKYIKFIDVKPENPDELPYFDIINKREGDSLGRIEYYSSWKRFCFFPASGSVFSIECLEDIATFIRNIPK